VLASGHRLREGSAFTRTVRSGARAGSRSLVCHVAVGDEPTRVGFIVPRSVGNAVTRNRVTRRLRHLMRARVADFSAPCVVVVRALPPASEASYAELARDLDHALAKASA
jgi:ribonuclease P protein component